MPRLTAPAKSFAADCCIVLDDVQFARRDYRHRCHLATLGDPGQQQWLSVPPTPASPPNATAPVSRAAASDNPAKPRPGRRRGRVGNAAGPSRFPS
ncbi:WbqC family protein [Streptomyces celluloflavus]|uniref:WbqC family protein n=1 Tax=Streptomyces celluloflavus TaxID=58344 RepID=UPI00346115B6|nr:WbqC family protein [Streptomyces celluloflavus]